MCPVFMDSIRCGSVRLGPVFLLTAKCYFRYVSTRFLLQQPKVVSTMDLRTNSFGHFWVFFYLSTRQVEWEANSIKSIISWNKTSIIFFLDFSQPRCGQLYNLFHSFDPISSRIEPIIDENFANVRPAPVPRCNAFPFNDDIQYNASSLFLDPNLNDEPDVSDSNSLRSHALLDRKVSSTSVSSNARKSAYNDKAFCKSQF